VYFFKQLRATCLLRFVMASELGRILPDLTPKVRGETRVSRLCVGCSKRRTEKGKAVLPFFQAADTKDIVTMFDLLKGISLTTPFFLSSGMGFKHRHPALGLFLGVAMALVCFAGMKRIDRWIDRNIDFLKEPGFKSDIRGNLLFIVVVTWIVGCSALGAFLTVQIVKHATGT
jgi:hypothetical protein